MKSKHFETIHMLKVSGYLASSTVAKMANVNP